MGMTGSGGAESKRLLVAGCGYLGTIAGLELASRGYQVWGLRRDASRLPPPLHPCSCDLLDPSSLAGLPAFQSVIYAVSPDAGTEESYRRAYTEGLMNLLQVLHPTPSRLLLVSSTAVYGQSGGEWVDEESVTEPAHFSGRILLEAESLLLARQDLVPIVFRPGGLYGPQRTGLLERVRSGEARRAPARHYTNRIHVEDAAAALRHLLELKDPRRIYIGVDCEPAEQREVLEWLASQLGVAVPEREARAEQPGRMLRTNKRCSNRRLLGSGFGFRFPTFREGYRAILDRHGLAG